METTSIATESAESASARAAASTDSSLLVTDTVSELALTRSASERWALVRAETALETPVIAAPRFTSATERAAASAERSLDVTLAPPGATLTQSTSPGADVIWRY